MSDKFKLWSASPSAVDCFTKCKRLWWRQYVLGDRGPTPAFMARGTSIHYAILESWLAKGEMLVEHENSDAPGVKHLVFEFTQAAIPHMPKPLTDAYWIEKRKSNPNVGLMIEQPGHMGTWINSDGSTGPEWRQYIDLVECGEDYAIITDIKTSSDPGRYAKTPDELSTNGQLIANAKWIFDQSDYKEITLRHLYLGTKTKRPKAFPVSVVVSREHVEKEWQKILGTVREMVNWAELSPEDPNVLPPTVEQCSAYGGCRFKKDCFDGAQDLITIRPTSRMKDGEKMNLLEKMMAKAGAAAKPVSGTVTAAGAAPVTALVQTQGEPTVGKVTVLSAPTQTNPPSSATPKTNLLAMLAAKKAAEAPSPPPADKTLTPAIAQAAAVAAGYPAEPPVGYDPNGIIPPDAPSRFSTPEEVAAANKEDEMEEKEETISSHGQDKASVAGEIVEGGPTRRKRRTKAEMEAARADEAAKAAAKVAAPAAPPATPAPSVNVDQIVAVGAEVVTTNVQLDVVSPKESLRELKERLGLKTSENNLIGSDEPKSEPDPQSEEIAKIRAVLTTPDPAFQCGVQALFIDCMPGKGWVGEQPVDALEFFHAFNALAASSAGAADYRLIKYESNGYLSTAIKVYQKGLPPVLYVDSRMSGAGILLETIIPYAKLVFRGVR